MSEKYITKKRFKDLGISGVINLPYGTVCEVNGDFIRYDGKPICVTTSENAHQYFALDNDGQGLVRGKLTEAIQKALTKDGRAESEAAHNTWQAKWDRVWEDKLCQKYRRTDFTDYWLWGHSFFNAPIDDLKHIAGLVGAKEV